MIYYTTHKYDTQLYSPNANTSSPPSGAAKRNPRSSLFCFGRIGVFCKRWAWSDLEIVFSYLGGTCSPGGLFGSEGTWLGTECGLVRGCKWGGGGHIRLGQVTIQLLGILEREYYSWCKIPRSLFPSHSWCEWRSWGHGFRGGFGRHRGFLGLGELGTLRLAAGGLLEWVG